MQNPEHGNDQGGCLSRAQARLRDHWKILIYGQLLSLFLASAGAAQATLHLDCSLSAPTFTMCVIYATLATVHIFQLKAAQNQKLRNQHQLAEETNTVIVVERDRFDFLCLHLQRPAWQYFIMALLDVEANAITMLAFRFTTLTSVTLYDALAIPSAMLLSGCFLARRYSWLHFAGVLACMIGVVLNVLGDYESDQNASLNAPNVTESNLANRLDEEYPNKLLGDVLAIIGGLLYGLNDVITEATVRHNGGTVEYLAMMGLFAFLIASCQAAILEGDAIREFFQSTPDEIETCSPTKRWVLFLVFTSVTVLSYMGASRFLMLSEAAFFNLSLLTGDLWSVLFSIVEEKIVPPAIFFVALVFVLSGVTLYEMAPHPVAESKDSVMASEHLEEMYPEFDIPEDQGLYEEVEVGMELT